jgi:diazepam-binding inhibitor (GABA receptor modulating acyl-CoA-binding protein)
METDISQGKAKYNKWQEQVNAGLSQKDAEAKYIELGEQLLKKHDN